LNQKNKNICKKVWKQTFFFLYLHHQNNTTMILIGFKSETTGVGHTEDNYANVTHQRMDIIAGSPTDTKEDLAKLYHAMVTIGEISRKKLAKLEDELEFSDISEAEYERLSDAYRKDTSILKYDRVLIIDGLILK
jgi:hypothetical protein